MLYARRGLIPALCGVFQPTTNVSTYLLTFYGRSLQKPTLTITRAWVVEFKSDVVARRVHGVVRLRPRVQLTLH